MGVEKEWISGLHAFKLKISVFHPEPILQHLVKYDIVLDKNFYSLIYCKFLIFFFCLLQLIIRDAYNIHILTLTLAHSVMKIYTHAFFLKLVVDFP